ncbi:MAG: hypothetical protein GXO72_01090 [Caldiserica bacterium]|nr:hypothetical protein [Caldisericota bacterium]
METPRSFEEFRACEALQRELDPPVPAPIPAWFLWEMARAGGLCLAAFNGIGVTREPLGLVVALRRGDGVEATLRVVLYGVMRDRPDRDGIREGLLAGLRDAARARGAAAIVWPFDPLEPEWAEFLFEHGARAEAYELRRARSGEIQAFRALAVVRGDAGEAPWRGAALGSFFPVNATRPVSGGLREPVSWNLHLGAERLLLEVPSPGISRLPRALREPWAEAWRALEEYLDRGYALVGLYRQRERAFLVLERAP